MTEQFSKIMTACNNSVADGGEFQWDCYGDDSRWVEFEFGDFATAEMVFNKNTREVYEVSVVYEDEREDAYLWVSPDYRDVRLARAEELAASDEDSLVEFTDVEEFEIFEEILTIIADGGEVELMGELQGDEKIVITWPKEELFDAMLAAHNEGMSFNDFVTDCIAQALENGGLLVANEQPSEDSGLTSEDLARTDGC